MIPRILITNDDGIYSDGLRQLAGSLRPIGEVIVVAPDREQSAASHALTLNRPLRLIELDQNQWTVDGTPTDCVNLAVLYLLKERRPDIVVSGINFGPNMGDDVTYSGTISAAFEGSLLGIPSIAFSALVGEGFSFERCAAFAARLTAIILAERPDPSIILNVNFPLGEFRGVRMTRLGERVYGEGVIERRDPRGRKYFWIGGDSPVWKAHPGTDFAALMEGYVSITPLHLDLTHHDSIERLKGLERRLDLTTTNTGN